MKAVEEEGGVRPRRADLHEPIFRLLAASLLIVLWKLPDAEFLKLMLSPVLVFGIFQAFSHDVWRGLGGFAISRCEVFSLEASPFAGGCFELGANAMFIYY